MRTIAPRMENVMQGSAYSPRQQIFPRRPLSNRDALVRHHPGSIRRPLGIVRCDIWLQDPDSAARSVALALAFGKNVFCRVKNCISNYRQMQPDRTLPDRALGLRCSNPFPEMQGEEADCYA